MAAVQRWTGAETAALRHAMRQTVRGFAERLGVEPGTVAKWERRGASITLLPNTQAMLDTALAQASEEVRERFHASVRQPDRHLEDPQRLASELCELRRLSQELGRRISGEGERSQLMDISARQSALLAYMSVHPSRYTDAEHWQSMVAPHLASAADGGTVHDEIVNWTEGRLPQLWRLDDLVGGKDCLEPAVADLRLVFRLISRGRYQERMEYRLLRMAGELCRFSGWAAFDAGRHAAAERYWRAGLRASAQVDDTETGAYILSQMAMQRTYAGDGRAAIVLLESARERVGTNTSMTVLAMLDTWLARAHAVAGEYGQARQVLARADTLWERRAPEDDPPFIYWMRRPSLTIEAGMALVATGEAETAARLLGEGMTERTRAYGRDTALGLAAIANARYAHGDLDGALDTANDAVELVADVTSTRVLDELDSFAKKLPATEPAAVELRERLARPIV
jgi:transcriptional regulator with XRE-family HTH domain/tetratricopeptide (TPR) repeat protein